MQDDYQLKEKLGRGKYSEVYHGYNIVKEQDAVIKMLKPINLDKVKKEVYILSELKQCKYITSLHEVIADPPTGVLSLVRN